MSGIRVPNQLEEETNLNPQFASGEKTDECDNIETDTEATLLLELERLKKVELIPQEEIERMINALHYELRGLRRTEEYKMFTDQEYKRIAEVRCLLKQRLRWHEWLVQWEVIDLHPLWRPLDGKWGKAGIMAYFPRSGFIGESPDIYQALLPHKILEEFAIDGYSGGLEALCHEQTHREQFDEPEAEREKYKQYSGASKIEQNKIKIALHRRAILYEGHALTVQEQCSDNENQFDRKKLTRLFTDGVQPLAEEHFLNIIRDSEDEDILLGVMEKIKFLNALEISHQEIVKCVRQAQWVDVEESDTKGYYDTIEALLNERMKEAGLKYTEVHSLVWLKDLKRQIYIEQVKIAAQEVIKRAYEKLGGSEGDANPP